MLGSESCVVVEVVVVALLGLVFPALTGLFLAPLGSAVLEPDFDLALVHLQRVAEASSLRARQILGLLEHLLQRIDLLARECGSRRLVALG